MTSTIIEMGERKWEKLSQRNNFCGLRGCSQLSFPRFSHLLQTTQLSRRAKAKIHPSVYGQTICPDHD
jgi:hypothetical protein